MGYIHVDSISVDSTQLCSEFKVYSSVGMTTYFFTVLDGGSAVELCLLACNIYSLMISFLYINGLNVEHFTKEKGA